MDQKAEAEIARLKKLVVDAWREGFREGYAEAHGYFPEGATFDREAWEEFREKSPAFAALNSKVNLCG